MNFNEYQAAALRTAKPDTLVGHLVHASLGLASLGLATEVKRMARYDKVMTPEMRQHMIEELGDTLWYIALAANGLGTTMEQMAITNIEKLKQRFPGEFTTDAAEARADNGGMSPTES